MGPRQEPADVRLFRDGSGLHPNVGSLQLLLQEGFGKRRPQAGADGVRASQAKNDAPLSSRRSLSRCTERPLPPKESEEHCLDNQEHNEGRRQVMPRSDLSQVASTLGAAEFG